MAVKAWPTRYLVISTDENRPGWSWQWAGVDTREIAERWAAEYRRLQGCEHLTFTVQESHGS